MTREEARTGYDWQPDLASSTALPCKVLRTRRSSGHNSKDLSCNQDCIFFTIYLLGLCILCTRRTSKYGIFQDNQGCISPAGALCIVHTENNFQGNLLSLPQHRLILTMSHLVTLCKTYCVLPIGQASAQKTTQMRIQSQSCIFQRLLTAKSHFLSFFPTLRDKVAILFCKHQAVCSDLHISLDLCY